MTDDRGPRVREPVEPTLPAGFSSTFVGEAWTIVQPWSLQVFVSLAVMLLIGTALLAVALARGDLLPIAFMAVWETVAGASMISHLVNRTFITCSSGLLTIKRRPLPLTRDIVLHVHDIDQLYVKALPKGRHALVARRKDGSDVSVIRSGRIDLDTAHVLEHTIERRLGIKDRRLSGERR